ncbi:MAG: hypothetical protein ACKVHP_00085 [Verrucomicrobiales bacterium]|jgi:hypothetical protein
MKNNLSQIIVVIFVGLIALFLSISIVAQGNVVANLAKNLAWISLLGGMVSPRRAIYLLFIYGAVLNLLKRLMVLDSMSGESLIYSNAPAPLLLAGAALGTLFHRLIARELLDRAALLSFVLPTAAFLAVAASAFGTGSNLGNALNIAANGGAYFFVIPVVMTWFRTAEDLLKLSAFVTLLFVPVAIYGMAQSFLGLNDFDYKYVHSGWTVLASWEEGDAFRAFSTVQSPAALGISCMVCIGLTLGRRYVQTNSITGALLSPLTIFLILIFLGGMFAAGIRNTWAGLFASFAAFFIFKHRGLAMSFYISLIGLYIIAVIFSKPLIGGFTSIAGYTNNLTRNETVNRFLTLETLADRFVGLNNMRTNSALWTPFGVKGSTNIDSDDSRRSEYARHHDYMMRHSATYVHDGISAAIIKLGYIPVSMLLLLGLLTAYYVHGVHQRSGDSVYGALIHIGLAISAGGLVTFFGSTRTLTQFPGNLFIGFAAALAVTAMVAVRKSEAEAVVVSGKTGEELPGSPYLSSAT